MRFRKFRLLSVAGVAMSLTLVLGAQPASADYAPSSDDVVGIGSDTVQFIVDFVADGFLDGALGYNSAGNKNKLINIDATADANSRLSYSSEGLGTGQCGPGTGAATGTGNQTTTHANSPCFQNPTVVLRAGFPPMKRPNGTSAGYQTFLRDFNNATFHLVDFSRASQCQVGPAPCANRGPVSGVDSIKVGDDPFAMLTATTTNAVPLSVANLNTIYAANTPNCATWDDFGGSSTNAIKPIIPQIGSGTRGSFLTEIGNPTVGNCAIAFEENDPTAIFQVGASADAITPMSGGRLNMYLGLNGAGASNGYGRYFLDPSCDVLQTTAGAGPGSCIFPPGNQLAPAVTLQTGAGWWSTTRPLYLYFRDADVGHTAPFGTNDPFQPGSTLNWVRTLFYNPCSAGQTGCVTVGATTYGPGGPPFLATAAGQALISKAGVPAAYVFQANGP